nr:unnamed protein product [Digitaria exilis]
MVFPLPSSFTAPSKDDRWTSAGMVRFLADTARMKIARPQTNLVSGGGGAEDEPLREAPPREPAFALRIANLQQRHAHDDDKQQQPAAVVSCFKGWDSWRLRRLVGELKRDKKCERKRLPCMAGERIPSSSETQQLYTVSMCEGKTLPCMAGTRELPFGPYDHTRPPLIDKAAAKMSTWHGKHLTQAGRVCLAKTVLTAQPVYFLTSLDIGPASYAGLGTQPNLPPLPPGNEDRMAHDSGLPLRETDLGPDKLMGAIGSPRIRQRDGGRQLPQRKVYHEKPHDP